ncbi:signal peptidase II [Lacicoccus alkaliphilus]|uniref:Lipoprotein signal peptidase n=1 Tax=Lacicoccus alkaliphilus DSM 16010 TaxID=1123231 RepID=A0A1M7CFA5_9BACL|nr:signal peptidase II [Salinicoccus alkaliphilus]SHL65894.1 signal peptidase II [Salinicoccus alkaliphilus DSM 16010]
MKKYRLASMGLLGGGLIALDQLTKNLVVRHMDIGESIALIDGFLRLTSHRNTGAAWGMFQGQMLFFYIVTVAVVGMLIYIYKKEAKDNLLMQLALTFLLAGAVGNFIDRILFQEVVDFVDVMIFGYDFPIFNVADSALTVGVVLMLIEFFFMGRGDENEQNNSRP